MALLVGVATCERAAFPLARTGYGRSACTRRCGGAISINPSNVLVSTLRPSCSSSPIMPLDPEEHAAVERVRVAANGQNHEYCEHEYNVYRWLIAYEGNEEEAAKALQRHLNIREIMSLTSLPNVKGDDIDEEAEQYVPLTILGRNRVSDNKVLLYEQSGKIDLSGVVDNIRITRFLRLKFRTMERLQQRVEQEERRLDKQSGGILIMDLDGLVMSTTLLSVLAGSGDVKATLLQHIDECCLPLELGGITNTTLLGESEVYSPIRHDPSAWREIYAGCERPALPQIDTWQWTVPHDGYYFIRYGNQKAWFYSVTVRHLIYELNETEKKIVTPISTFVD
uniref:WW domain-containing protein n=1 Tax=Angiostrongylus cantonensis TaxID=6313 RepID=A0A158PAC9_ANGCA